MHNWDIQYSLQRIVLKSSIHHNYTRSQEDYKQSIVISSGIRKWKWFPPQYKIYLSIESLLIDDRQLICLLFLDIVTFHNGVICLFTLGLFVQICSWTFWEFTYNLSCFAVNIHKSWWRTFRMYWNPFIINASRMHNCREW